ncbi:MAG: bis(5'-nucleosyl)-tetraphosphatase (symmetrical) YqeK [Erysipelotrichaceae bacterium]|nr:bis(5'-nucleosyl)-tetraphosphatase (symmetrical) YqeK [Erysipelotrichaceae bacterium]
MRIGLIRSAFAPILTSHIKQAQAFCKQYQLDEVWLLPDENFELPMDKRMAMIRLAIAPYRKLHAGMPDHFDYEWCLKQPVFDFRRDWIQVKPNVRQYMMEHDVYIEQIAQSLVTEKRWVHVKSMTQLAIELAQCHQVSTYDAKVAGLFHDATKRWTVEDSLSWMRFCAPNRIMEANAIHHQYTGAAFCKRVLKIRNQKVIQAILHHVKGDDPNSLSQILYLADKLDPSRDYDSSKEIDLCKKDLKAGMAVVKQQQLAYLRKEGVQI